MTFNDTHRRDILMMRGLNRTYDEIAAYLNEKHDLDVSGGSVGTEVRDMEDRSEAESPEAVFDEVVISGYIGDIL